MLALLAPRTPRAEVEVGGELRERYELVRNEDWGRAPVDEDGWLLQRAFLRGSYRRGGVRVLVELQSSLVLGRDPRGTDLEPLDIHQALLELPVGEGWLRAGRQELSYGASRLVSVREGPNVRRSFDGVRLHLARGHAWLDAIALAAVDNAPGVFDNAHEAALWGAYGSASRGPFGVDLYYLGLARSDEVRHSAGVHAWGRGGGFTVDGEALVQGGTHARRTIRAATGALAVTFTTGDVTVGLKLAKTSGDRDPDDAVDETFDPLFPRGNYFGEAALIGPRNHVDVHPSLDVALAKELHAVADVDVFWLARPEDGVYHISGAQQVMPTGTRARHVGTQASVGITWSPRPRTTVTASVAHFVAGPVLRAAGLERDVNFIAAWIVRKL